MAVNTAAGSTFAIAPQAGMAGVDWNADDDATIIAAMELLSWTEVGEVEDLGEFGDEASEITFTALANRRTRKFKGTFNAGTVTVQAGSDFVDAGQAALIAAFDSPFRIQLNDQLTLAGTPTTLYFGGKVMSKRRNVGNVENVVRQSYPVGVNTQIVEDPAT